MTDAEFVQEIIDYFNDTVDMKSRTLQQNKALHQAFTLLADSLNEAGLDCRVVMKPEAEIPWSPEMVKNLLYRPIMEVMTDKHSTTELDRIEPSQVWDVLMRHLGEKLGVQYIAFPADENDTRAQG